MTGTANLSAAEVYAGSDGGLTRSFYAALERCGPIGAVAVNLFRAQKCSARAKKYRGGIRGVGSYRSLAYDRKRWSMENLVQALAAHGAVFGIRYGWREDPGQNLNAWVLYVDLPQGQVSFHSPDRLAGPDYPADWDGRRQSAERIISFCDSVLEQNARNTRQNSPESLWRGSESPSDTLEPPAPPDALRGC